MEALSLHELNALVRRSLEQCLPDEFWVQAELSDVRTNSTGHCYLEFVQKDPRSNSLIAKARGTIWANVFRLLKPYFEEATGQAFVSGIKVLVQVTVNFHELYGYSLTVQDIDPTYTLGDMARRRREILKQLEEEGVLTLNKELEMPRLPQRIAVQHVQHMIHQQMHWDLLFMQLLQLCIVKSDYLNQSKNMINLLKKNLRTSFILFN